MPQKYTVKSVMATGKSDPKFGTEFYVQFNETEQAFPLWYKNAPAVGFEQEGDIVAGKFKKVKKEWNPNGPSQQGTASAPTAPKKAWNDNSDGMRQGMCFNNAANYVSTLEFKAALTDKEWATTVFSYAQALYLMGDLNQAPEGSQEEIKDPFEDK